MKHLIKRILAWDGLAPGEGGFIQAALTAAPYVLNALGGIFGTKKRYIDPEELRSKYGPQATAKDTQSLVNFILNSPYGQELMKQAAEAGQGLQTEMAQRAASAGLSPETGGESGASTFATSAAAQAQTGLERQAKASLWQAALPVAAQQNAAYSELALANQAARNEEPTMFQKIAAAAPQLQSIGGAVRRTVKKPGESEGFTAPFRREAIR